MVTGKEALVHINRRLAIYAKKLGFHDIRISDDGEFYAINLRTDIEVRRYYRYGGQVQKEISWHSAGTPRPTLDYVKYHIMILKNAVKLYERL